MNAETIHKALEQVKYPGFSRDIVSFGLVQGCTFDAGKAVVSLAITTQDDSIPVKLKQSVEAAVLNLDGIDHVDVRIAVTKPKSAPPPAASGGGRASPSQLGKVRFAVAVASGKGGVGKSTFTVNLACALDSVIRERGRTGPVGVLDCDIYGPSVPLMLGINGEPDVEGENLLPMENYGLKVMSMGVLIDAETPVVWRGPMIMKTIQQFATNVAWGALEVLVIDLPPGTGDAQLSLVQTIPLSGALIVTTPQLASVAVTRRGAGMFGKVNVPLLGVAENMSYLEQDGGREKLEIFGSGGGQQVADDLDTQLMGKVPLDPDIRAGGDRGIPIVIAKPESTAAQAFMEIARKLLDSLENKSATAT